MRSHRIEYDIVLAHDAPVVTGAGAAAATLEVTGAALVETVVPEAPSLGTTVVMIRCLITFLTTTGRG